MTTEEDKMGKVTGHARAGGCSLSVNVPPRARPMAPAAPPLAPARPSIAPPAPPRAPARPSIAPPAPPPAPARPSITSPVPPPAPARPSIAPAPSTITPPPLVTAPSTPVRLANAMPAARLPAFEPSKAAAASPGRKRGSRARLGELLVAEGVISQDQLHEALREPRRTKERPAAVVAGPGRL